MTSITLSVPEEIRKLMKRFPEVNWSGFIRKSIEEKARNLETKEELLKQLEGEKDFNEWAVELQKISRKGRFEQLKKRGLI